ncbi:MAG: hypothetical protein BWK76_18040 [Desulfobulbaceae bacterium A2]|nr:MAG: hypothetical protein BWK76_18040 [Desulfobulbaceae bacterium A2]
MPHAATSATVTPPAAIKHLAAGFSLAEIERLVLLRSPALRAAEEEYRAVGERYAQSTALNDLLGRYAAFTRGSILPAATGGDFPFPGLTALRSDIVRQETAVAAEQLAISRRTVLTAARRAFWELFYAHQAHTIALRDYEVVDSLKNTTAAAYAAGKKTIEELLRVDMDHGLMKEAIPIRLEARQVREAELLALLDLPSATRLGVPRAGEPLTELPALAALEQQALTNRQELRALRAGIVKTELLIALAEAESNPGYTLGTAAGPAPASDNLAPAALSPRGAFHGLEQGYLRELRRTLAAQRHRLTAEEASTRALVQGAWTQLSKALREERLARDKVIPLARTALDTTTAAYAAGNAGYPQMLDASSRWFAATLNRQRSRADIGLARASLAEASGNDTGSSAHRD